MSYSASNGRLNTALLRTFSCPYLFPDTRCAGGDYCPFPSGREHRCCFFCARFGSCPDRSGICSRLEG